MVVADNVQHTGIRRQGRTTYQGGSYRVAEEGHDMKALIGIALVMAIALMGWFGFHTWYVDTHCATILGTQICEPLVPPAPAAQPATVAPATDTPLNGAPGCGGANSCYPSAGSGDPATGTGTGAVCTTIAGYYSGGLPGHEDPTGFCVAD